MMSLPLYVSLLAGWMVLALTALLATGASSLSRGVLAFVLLGLCGAGHIPVADAAQALMALCPALALCVETCRGGGGGRSGWKALRPFILSGNASLALALGRCDLLGVFIGISLVVRLAGAWGPRGPGRDGWRLLRATLGGLILAQGGLFVLRAGWGPMPGQAGAVLLVGGLLMACGLLSPPAAGQPEGNMNGLMVLPIIARAAGSWPQLTPVLTFFGGVCLLWSLPPRPGGASRSLNWSGWAVMAAGLPAGQAALPLAACLLMLACPPPVGQAPQNGGRVTPWPPFLPGMALVLVLVAEMRASLPVALLAGVSLWPFLAGGGQVQVTVRGQGGLLLALGCMVLAIVAYRGMVQP
ncbi:hypothetical protein [Komagataeibacter sp. FNDCR2]|uniref:hypothetical protein n=1 Tax=Komagataeibacter sp. FNDCR2 TaxID=2878682 RepID=UPI001E58D6E0|nr:hypothetical protein [Komagataeibacter sp. FNDCR2]MCE2574974.1 hypothetical protein [Komagataeibacter sp. FNDCR2]